MVHNAKSGIIKGNLRSKRISRSLEGVSGKGGGEATANPPSAVAAPARSRISVNFASRRQRVRENRERRLTKPTMSLTILWSENAPWPH